MLSHTVCTGTHGLAYAWIMQKGGLLIRLLHTLAQDVPCLSSKYLNYQLRRPRVAGDPKLRRETQGSRIEDM